MDPSDPTYQDMAYRLSTTDVCMYSVRNESIQFVEDAYLSYSSTSDT